MFIGHIPHLIKVGLREVVLVHVVNIGDAGSLAVKFQEYDHLALEAQRQQLEQQGLQVTVKIPMGFPSYEINQIAEDEQVSLIMIGSHGSSVLKKVVLGRNSEQIIRDARKPVLIVKLTMEEGSGCNLFCENLFQSILYPTDFSDDAEKVFPYLKQSVDAGCEKIVLLHVQEEQRIKPHLESRLEEFNQIDQDRLDRMKRELEALGAQNVKTIIRMGKTIPTILTVAEEEQSCLVALGARGRSLLGEIFIGSTANNVARYAKCPVLFVT